MQIVESIFLSVGEVEYFVLRSSPYVPSTNWQNLRRNTETQMVAGAHVKYTSALTASPWPVSALNKTIFNKIF